MIKTDINPLKLFQRLRGFAFLSLALFVLAQSVECREPTPLKVYIREVLYDSLKKILPTSFPLTKQKSKHAKVPQRRSIEWIPLSEARLYARLKLEGDETPADVVVGLASDAVPEIKASPFPAELRENLHFPFQWKNRNFLPLYYGYLSILYNAKKISVPSQSLWELVDVKTDESLIFPDPHTSSTGFGFVAWLIESLPQANQSNWDILKTKVKATPASEDFANTFFHKGQASLIVSYTTSTLYHRQNKEPYIKAILFPEGNPLHVFVAFKTLKAAQDSDADALLRILTLADIQTAIASKFWMYPVLESVMTEDLINLPKPDKIFVPRIRSRQTILDRWQTLMGQVG
jgi:thiamine transport system substrate-binding protein